MLLGSPETKAGPCRAPGARWGRSGAGAGPGVRVSTCGAANGREGPGRREPPGRSFPPSPALAPAGFPPGRSAGSCRPLVAPRGQRVTSAAAQAGPSGAERAPGSAEDTARWPLAACGSPGGQHRGRARRGRKESGQRNNEKGERRRGG